MGAASAEISIDCRRLEGAKRSGRASVFLLLLLAGPAAGAVAGGAVPETTEVRARPAAHRILVLYSDDRLRPANIVFDSSLRDALRSSDEPIDCYSEFLDEVRFPADYAERTRDLLRAKYGDSPPELIVAFSPPALGFCIENRDQLFPQVPIIFAGLDRDSPAGSLQAPRITGLRSTFDGPATLTLALRLHPRAQHVFVVDGSAQVDTAVVAVRRSTFRRPLPHPTFHHLSSQPLPQLLEQLQKLPENSLVIDFSGFGSNAESGVPAQELVERMARISLAPIYAAFDPLVGNGVVGAVATPTDAIGRKTAELVSQVLATGPAGPLPGAATLAATPIFDWRELRRWGVRQRQLPRGSIVRFAPPSFWRQHLALVVTTSALFLLQSGLIIALVLQSRRRRRAELEAQRRREELAHMTRVATMGELTASLAHEINQPLAAILSNAQAGQRLLAAGSTDVEEIGEILADIAADDQRAGEVIRRMRALLRKGGTDLTVLSINDLVAEVIGLVRGELILQNVSLSLDLSADPPLVHGDQIQLQQVILNLVVNALDAMKEKPTSSRRLVLRTSAPQDRSAHLSVEDSGAGIPADRLEQVFEPFVTTKAHGIGLGLAICRSIIQAHGGRIGCTNNSGRGATFWFTLPAVEKVRV